MKKMVINVTAIVVGLGMCLLSRFVFRDMLERSVVAVIIGVGASTFGVGISGVIAELHMRRHPKERQQREIEELDERNRMIRERAKAKSADLVQWFVLAVAYVSIAMDEPMWMTGLLVLVFVVKNVLDIVFMARIEKEN